MISSVVEFSSIKQSCSDSASTLPVKGRIVERILNSGIKIEPSNGDLSYDSQHSSSCCDDSVADRKFRRKSCRPQKVTTVHTMQSEQQQQRHQQQQQQQHHQNQGMQLPIQQTPRQEHNHNHQHQLANQATVVLPPPTPPPPDPTAAPLGLCETCGSPLATVRNAARPGDLIVLCVDCTCDKITLLLEESADSGGDGRNLARPEDQAVGGSGATAASAAYVCRLCQPPKLFAASGDYLEHYVCEHEHRVAAVAAAAATAVAAKSATSEVAPDDAENDVGGVGGDGGGSHSCSHCGLDLRSEDDLEQHERFHLECEFDPSRLRCYYCCKEFAELDALNAHQRAHSTERPHYCNVCDRAFSFACTLQRHMLVHQAYHSTYTCHYCDQTFSDAGQMDRHFDVCERNMDDATDLTAAGDGPKQCAPSRFLPYSHTCSTCGKSFRLAWRYKLHMRAACNTADKYNADSDRTCSICKKMFANPMNLHRHELIHAGIRNYQCKLCGKAFVQKTQLETHMNIHNGIKPFQCEVCNKNFTDRSTFHKHKKIHGKPKSFPCGDCGKVFNQAGYLKLHAKVHISGGSGGGASSRQPQPQPPQPMHQDGGAVHEAEYSVAAAAAAVASVPSLNYCNLDQIKLSM